MAYSPGDITGKKILLVSNLKPAVIFKKRSEGMLLAAKKDKKDVPALIIVDDSIPVGGAPGLMLIGLMSDTHNDVEMTRKALDVFRERDVSMVLHAGDLTSPRMLTLFEGLEVRLVLGNGDLDEDVINSESERLGFGPVGKTCVFTAGERVFQMFHGNNVPAFRHAIASAKYDYIIKGHTQYL